MREILAKLEKYWLTFNGGADFFFLYPLFLVTKHLLTMITARLRLLHKNRIKQSENVPKRIIENNMQHNNKI
jgi:hypothetical protein